jgi:hypothetical protein
MGVKIPSSNLTVFSLLSVFILGLAISSSQAQVAITDANRFEVSFSEDQTVTRSQSVNLSVADLERLVGEAVPVAGNLPQWTDRSSSGFYVGQMANQLAVNGLRPASDESVFAKMSFRNDTGTDFSAIEVAFDFVYRSDSSLNGSLQLYFRVNRNEWREVPGSSVALASLQRGSSEWSSFSIQSNIGQMYLRNGDRIEFAWIPGAETSTSAGELPIALQQIELNPQRAQVQPPSRGSLIITEIMTSEPDADRPEFIEIFNPTSSSIPLRGMTLETGSGSIVVQSDVSVQPYSFFVMVSAGRHTEIPFEYGYRYPVKLLSPGSGYAELRFGNEESAKATYDMAEAGIAMELDRVSNAFDGYTSMQYMNASPFEIGDRLRGTPGRRGVTSRMFAHRVDQPGWHLISLPGIPNARLNRQGGFEFMDTAGSEIVPDNSSMRQLVLIYTERGESPAAIYVDEAERVGSDFRRTDIESGGSSTGFSFLTVPGIQPVQVGRLVNEMNLPVTPAIMTWDAELQTFRLKFGSDAVVNPWNPVIINSEVQTPVSVLDEDRTSSAADLDRFITFRFFEEQQRREVLKDEAILGFVDSRRLRTERRFDLPRLNPLIHPDNAQDTELTMMHLSNSRSAQRSNSFTHLPYELDDTYRIGIGLTTTKPAMQGVLEWSVMEDIPDEWVLILEDRVTGNEINMREQSSYRFRYTTTASIDRDRIAENPFSPVVPKEDERFAVTLKPYQPALETAGGDVRPGSVELRQNYPNPFNPATNIVYYLPEERHIRIGIYNVVGQQVALLVDDTMRAGENSVVWNASDMPSGIYIVQLETGNRIFTRKITLIK